MKIGTQRYAYRTYASSLIEYSSVLIKYHDIRRYPYQALRKLAVLYFYTDSVTGAVLSN